MTDKKQASSGIVFHSLNTLAYEEDCKLTCELAGLSDEYQTANDTEDRQKVIDKACDILGIRIERELI